MSRPEHVETAITQAYKLEALIRVLSLAIDGEDVRGMTFERAGVASILDMAANLAGEIVSGLENGEKQRKAG